MSDWYLTVDGGGTGMRLAAYLGDEIQPQASFECATPGSLTLGVERSAAGIRSGIAQLKRLCPALDGAPRHIQCGLAGSLEPSRMQRFIAQWPGQAVVVVTDGYGQLIGATAGAPGACLSVGTGSVVHWLESSGLSGMAGGWGFPVGDLGGGAQIGLRWIQLELEHFDKQGPSALLAQTIADNKPGIQAWCAAATATEYAALCPAIVNARDNPAALRALAEARTALDELLSTVPAGLPCYLAGSLGVALLKNDARFVVSQGTALDGLRRIQLGLAPKENMQ